MTLRKKSFLIVAGTALALLASLYFAGRRIILDSALALEQENVSLDLARVIGALDAESARLVRSAGDWAAWDESYAFVADRNPAFVVKNLDDESLRTLDIGAMLFLDRAGQVVAAKELGVGGEGTRGLARALQQQIARDPGAWALGRPVPRRLLALDGRFAIVASRPIVDSLRTAPPRGTLLFAQPLDIGRTATAARIAHLEAAIMGLDDARVPADVRERLGRSGETDPIVVVRPKSFRAVAGWILLRDFAGGPPQALVLTELRAIYVQGVRSLSYFMGALALSVFAFGLMVAVLLERLVLSRLSRLSAGVQGVVGAADLSLRVDVRGGDEIAALATEVNRMFGRLEEAHAAVRRSRDELEQRVRERTAELESANRTLQGQIRERQRAEEALRALKEELERQNSDLRTIDRMKDALIGDVSHELRTPVAKQAMQLELLRGELERRGIRDGFGKVLDVMDGALRRQQSVIRNILTLSHLEAGGREVRLGPVRIDEMIAEILGDYQATLETCDIAVTVEVPALTLQADRELLWHVFSNLISNAVKYRGRRDPQVRISAQREDGTVRVTVADNGVGFAPETRERLFERFYQESAAIEGIGLGLHIVRTILERMHGTVAIHSAGKGQGTVAEVVLPISDAAA
jgi:signal transduction histidine kinase